MAVNPTQTETRPRWPTAPFVPKRSWFDYDAEVDELVLYFGRRPVASYTSLIDASDVDHTGVLVGLGPNHEATGDVVGIHIYPMLGTLAGRPEWRSLTEPNPAPEAVARFVAEVRELFERYWTPPPPIEEQLARARRHGEADADGSS